MTAKDPFDLKVISDVLQIGYDSLRRWVRDCILKIDSAGVQEELHGKDFETPRVSGAGGTIGVAVFRPEEVGPNMAVDEKYIKQEYYTILTNADTGRIAMMCRSMDYPTLVVALLRFGCDTLDRVRTVTRDLSPTFESVCSMVFPEAVQTADKFHVVTHLTKAMQDYRVRLKKDAERHERKAAKKHAEKYRENASRPASERIPMRKKYQVPRLPNGETRAELLHRSRYLLYKSPGDWTVSQRQRARLLFSCFPGLEDAYILYIRFREWYSPDPSGGKDFKDWQLSLWIKHAREHKQKPFDDFCSMIENNREYIVNYFDGYRTNAIAESTNAKIQLATIKNRGSRDLDFFLYRIANFL